MRYLIIDSVSGDGFSFAPGDLVDMSPADAARKLGKAAVPAEAERAVAVAPEAAVSPAVLPGIRRARRGRVNGARVFP